MNSVPEEKDYDGVPAAGGAYNASIVMMPAADWTKSFAKVHPEMSKRMTQKGEELRKSDYETVYKLWTWFDAAVNTMQGKDSSRNVINIEERLGFLHILRNIDTEDQYKAWQAAAPQKELAVIHTAISHALALGGHGRNPAKKGSKILMGFCSLLEYTSFRQRAKLLEFLTWVQTNFEPYVYHCSPSSRFGVAAQYVARCGRLGIEPDLSEFPGVTITKALAEAHVKELDDRGLSSEADREAHRGSGCALM